MAIKKYALVFKNGSRVTVDLDESQVDVFIQGVMGVLEGKISGADTWYMTQGFAFLASELLVIGDKEIRPESSSNVVPRAKVVRRPIPLTPV